MSAEKTATGDVKIAVQAVLEESMVDEKLTITAKGDWVSSTIGQVNTLLRAIEAKASRGVSLVFDMRSIGIIDTSGTWLISRLRSKWEAAGGEVEIVSNSKRASTLLKAVNVPVYEAQTVEKKDFPFVRMLYSIGRFMMAVKRDAAMALSIIGAAIRGPQMKDGQKGGVRFVSIVHHIDKMGFRAVPIIVLMSLLLGAIVAQQAAFQLRFFGLEAWAADFSSASLLREIAVLLTAIMIAGRSGSSMTAEIGSMKMREEVDALTVIGLNPIGVLVFPRLVALTICLPLLTFVANMAALLGAALVLRFYSDVPFEEFLSRVRTYIDLETVFAGIIKAPFMGFAIGLMSAIEGMKVEGSAESLGRRTTAAVVKSIFMVILIDGFFSVFYASIDY